MNIDRESVIKWAREAEYGDAMADLHASALERFAALVTAATAKEYEERLRFTQERWEIECKSQVEIEREACAKVCEAMRPSEREFDQRFFTACTLNANAIRARGQE